MSYRGTEDQDLGKVLANIERRLRALEQPGALPPDPGWIMVDEDGELKWRYVPTGVVGPAIGLRSGVSSLSAELTQVQEAVTTLQGLGTAGGDLTGTYPNPSIAEGAVTDFKVAAANKDGSASVPSMRTLGTGAFQAAAGNDPRFGTGTPTGPAGGDLTGNYPNPTIAVGAVDEYKRATATNTVAASRALLFSDVGDALICTASPTLTTDGSIATSGASGWRLGQSCTIVNNDAGTTTVVAGGGDALATPNGATLVGSGATGVLTRVAATAWLFVAVSGDSFNQDIRNQTTLQASANFNIQSAAAGSVVGVLRAAAGQTASVLELQDSAGAVLSLFNASGSLGVGTPSLSAGLLTVGTNTTTPAGGMWFGTDVNMYRSAANTLRTDDTLAVGGKIAGENLITTKGTVGSVGFVVDYTGGKAAALTSGTLRSAFLFDETGTFSIQARTSAQVLSGSAGGVDTVFEVDAVGNLGLGLFGTLPIARIQVPAGTTAAEGILFGTDTNLYRFAANVLKTNDFLDLTINTTSQPISGSGIGDKLGLYSSSLLNRYGFGIQSGQLVSYFPSAAAFTFKTAAGSGSASAGTIIASVGLVGPGTTEGITFGSTNDTNLYRSASNTLKTDDSFHVGNRVTISSAGLATINAVTNGKLLLGDSFGSIHWAMFNAAADANAQVASAGSNLLSLLGYSGPGFLFGAGGASALDTALYRSAATTLRTNGSLIVDGTLTVGTPETYTESNVTTDRSYDANSTTLDEVADVLGTLINDLRTLGLVL